jgi:hypothetical protein
MRLACPNCHRVDGLGTNETLEGVAWCRVDIPTPGADPVVTHHGETEVWWDSSSTHTSLPFWCKHCAIDIEQADLELVEEDDENVAALIALAEGEEVFDVPRSNDLHTPLPDEAEE